MGKTGLDVYSFFCQSSPELQPSVRGHMYYMHVIDSGTTAACLHCCYTRANAGIRLTSSGLRLEQTR